MRTWIIGIVGLLLWSAGSTYWYVCRIQGLCPGETTHVVASSDSPPAHEPSSGENDSAATETVDTALNPSNFKVALSKADLDRALSENLQQPRTVLFAFAEPETEGRDALNGYLSELAAYLRTHPSQKVILRGYTDDTAARENNLKLSQRRCDAIAAMLTALGVDGGQILTEPLGEADPVATNDTPEGRRLNRRVVISIQE